MRFMKKGVKLSPYPFVITLYVEDREPAFQCAGGRSFSLSTLPEVSWTLYNDNMLWINFVCSCLPVTNTNSWSSPVSVSKYAFLYVVILSC